MDHGEFLLPLCIITLGLHLLNTRVASPIVSIANRWVRWLLFSGSVAYVAGVFGWSGRPFWAVAGMAFIAWFMLESIYNWAAIRALSLSPQPLFPRFTVNTGGDEWPTQRRLFWIRDWLRAGRFTQTQALKAEIAPGAFLRVSVYQNPEALDRIQIAFIPHANSAVSLCCTVSTNTDDGMRYVTDNLYLPFGGFFPENWRVDRCPWVRSIPKLVEHHRERLRRDGVTSVPWGIDPLDDLNKQQSQLEVVNTELGFLAPHSDREENGKLTPEGRYRVWKEVWMLNYLGRTVGGD